MTKLEYTFKTDTLFKMLFVKYPDLLRRLVSEFKEIERLRSKARHDEAQALWNAQRQERARWQIIIADKDAENEKLRAMLTQLQEQLNKPK